MATTGRSTHARQMNHKEVIARSASNALYKHHWSKHPDLTPSFQTGVLRGGIKYNVDRFIHESLEIEQLRLDPSVDLINQRSKGGHAGLVRLNIATT